MGEIAPKSNERTNKRQTLAMTAAVFALQTSNEAKRVGDTWQDLWPFWFWRKSFVFFWEWIPPSFVRSFVRFQLDKTLLAEKQRPRLQDSLRKRINICETSTLFHEEGRRTAREREKDVFFFSVFLHTFTPDQLENGVCGGELGFSVATWHVQYTFCQPI